MVKTAFIIFFLIGIAVSSYGQNKQPLRILRTTKDTLDIRYNDYLDSLSWILSPRKKIDILPIEIDNTPVRVTFISDADSLSFNVKLGEKYDFIIANGSKNYPTRIEGIQAYQTSKDDSLANVNLAQPAMIPETGFFLLTQMTVYLNISKSASGVKKIAIVQDE
jgi:hypothetical protein